MTAIGVVVAALIAWFENARARRLGIWVLLVVGLWDAARRAFPDGGARAALPIALLGVAVLGVVTTGAALADRWVELRGGSSTKPAGLR
ncbi:MAG TPA: hypothetical protein VEB59_17035, partial [Gemmatimonadales bacterium]|nr:hypothetical protein [Gemmatimonadales bacterium]